jgi:PIN domain nuclease of toxin-antitoxin system
MRLLVDTHVLLWAVAEPRKLPKASRAKLEAGENDVRFSAASIWELAIKLQLGRLNLPVELDTIAESEKPMSFADSAMVSSSTGRLRRLISLHRNGPV